tara:strand:- start:550 stop:747 length:198 start_codon:yes stop_codon:yes gene_type:complete
MPGGIIGTDTPGGIILGIMPIGGTMPMGGMSPMGPSGIGDGRIEGAIDEGARGPTAGTMPGGTAV